MNSIKEKIYYWSPFLSPIATSKAVINSAASLMKYSSNYESNILNFFGEFDESKQLINEKKIKLLGFYNFNITKKLPYKGFIKSRISFILIFLLGFYPLKKFLKKNEPDFLIIHLITSLPLLLLIFFNFKTKFILRISGMPRMNILRKLLWKIALKKVYNVTCPTMNTLNYIKNLNIIEENKLKLLYDPILEIRKIVKKREERILYKNYFLSVGRLSKQKNFIFLCKAFKEIVKLNSDSKLLIAGNGEDETLIKRFIEKNKLNKNIILIGFKDNIYPYFKNASGFILTSLWEDPGFVLVEASFCRTPILSSDAWPGPIELIKDKKNGFIFESNNLKSFLKNFKDFANRQKKNEMIINGLKMSNKFTLFSHYKELNKILRK